MQNAFDHLKTTLHAAFEGVNLSPGMLNMQISNLIPKGELPKGIGEDIYSLTHIVAEKLKADINTRAGCDVFKGKTPPLTISPLALEIHENPLISETTDQKVRDAIIAALQPENIREIVAAATTEFITKHANISHAIKIQQATNYRITLAPNRKELHIKGNRNDTLLRKALFQGAILAMPKGDESGGWAISRQLDKHVKANTESGVLILSADAAKFLGDNAADFDVALGAVREKLMAAALGKSAHIPLPPK